MCERDGSCEFPRAGRRLGRCKVLAEGLVFPVAFAIWIFLTDVFTDVRTQGEGAFVSSSRIAKNNRRVWNFNSITGERFGLLIDQDWTRLWFSRLFFKRKWLWDRFSKVRLPLRAWNSIQVRCDVVRETKCILIDLVRIVVLDSEDV